MENFLHDLRYGSRMLVKSLGFTAIAVLSLTLGIGANTAIFTLVNAVLLKPLPVEEPDQLVLVLTQRTRGLNYNHSYPLYKELRDRNEVFSGLIAHSPINMNLSHNDQTERIGGEIVSGNYFSTLGISPALGRAFFPEEDVTPGAHPVALVGYGLWQRRFGSDPGLIGQTINLNGNPFTVVGIAPKGFSGVHIGSAAEIWVPMMMQQQAEPRFGEMLSRPGASWLYIMGRLKPGITLSQAQAAMDTILRQFLETHRRPAQESIALQPGSQGHSQLPENLSLPLLLLMGAVALVLLIACANLANLLLARASSRRKEIAIRQALGASRGRLIRQLLTESLMLSALGGAGGILLALWSTDLLVAFLPSEGRSQTVLDLSLDARVIGFALLLSVATGILFGLAPALRASRPELIPALKDEAAPLGGRVRKFGLSNLLVMTQVAISLVLLIGAGLFVRTLQNLQGLNIGFEARNILLMSVDLDLQGYKRERSQEFYRQMAERTQSLPGVRSVSWASVPPVNLGGSRTTVTVEGYEPAPDEDMELNFITIGLNYFQTLGIPLVRGRDFTEQDRAKSPDSVIINETMARRYWPGQDPVGRRMKLGGPEGTSLEVIGVARDGKYRSMREAPRPSFYLSLFQMSRPGMVLHVRTAGDPETLIAAVRNEARALDKDLPVFDVKTLSDQLDQALAQERLASTLSGLFALLALLLAGVGIYGVLAYSVSRRTREIGIRMALGAQRGDVLKLVLRQSMGVVIVGVVIGLVVAFYLTQIFSSLLYNVSATDPATFIVIALLLVVVAFAASYLPARRAAKVDPMAALRYE